MFYVLEWLLLIHIFHLLLYGYIVLFGLLFTLNTTFLTVTSLRLTLTCWIFDLLRILACILFFFSHYIVMSTNYIIVVDLQIASYTLPYERGV